MAKSTKDSKQRPNYGKRIDSTDKERGYLGEIRMPNQRDVMTEMSVGEPNTNELFRPAIIPGMHPADINYIRELDQVPEDVLMASLRHAQKRIKEGKSPFWNAREDLERQFINEDAIPHMAGAGSVTKAVEEISKAVKGAEAGKGIAQAAKAIPKMKATEAVDLPYTTKQFNTEVKKFSKQIAKDKPNLSDEDVIKAASFQADKKLKWELVQKPALEAKYGTLEDAPYSASNPEKMRSTQDVVQQRIEKAQDFLAQPTEAWQPPPENLWAFDRNAIRDALEGFPDVEQSKFPRDMPTRASTEHVSSLYDDPVNRELIKSQIKRGLPLGGETFYASLYPVKQAVIEAGGTAEDFDKWIHSLAPASARNSILNEMASGQFLRDMNARGIELTDKNVAEEMAKFKLENKIGLPLMPIHRQGVANVLEGGINLRDQNLANIPTNYKIPTYGTQKAGDFAKSAVLDVHEAGGQSYGTPYHPYFNEQGGFGNTEYDIGEKGLLSIADELGIPGGMAQAGRWFGGGELTGLRSPRGDALDLLEKQVAYTLQQRGIQPNPANVREEIMKQIITGEGTLLPWFKKEGLPDVRTTGLQRAEGGSVDLEDEFIKADTFAGGGSAKKDDYRTIAADPTAYFMNEMPTSEPSLKERARTLGHTAKASLEKELQSYKAKHAGTDIANDWIANLVGAPVDLTNMVLSPFGVGSEEPVMGSQFLKHKMHDYGMHTGTKRPWTEAGTAFVSPQSAVKGIAKAAEITKDMPVGMMIKDVSQGAQFVSPLEKTVNAHKMEAMPGPQWSSWLSANAPKGAKKEAEASGLHDWLKTQPKVSKGDIEAFLGENRPQVRVVEKGAPLKLTADEQQELTDLGGKLSGSFHGMGELTEDEMNRVMYLENISEQAKPLNLRHQAEQWEKEARKAQKAGNDMTAKIAFNRSEYLGNRADQLELNPLDYGGSKFETYTLPGGKNYQETMLTLPSKAKTEMPEGFQITEGVDPITGKSGFYAETPNTRSVLYLNRNEAERQLQNYAGNANKAESESMNYSVPSYHGYEDPDADINRVAHLRTNERPTADNKRALFLEELQSDWAQKGRDQGFKRDLTSDEMERLNQLSEKRKQLFQEQRELAEKYSSPFVSLSDSRAIDERYGQTQQELMDIDREQVKLDAVLSNNTPSGPYVTDTKDWTALGLKHALKKAVDEGHDYLAWTTGQQQADRYSLATYLDDVRATKNADGTYSFGAFEKGSDSNLPDIKQEGLTEQGLADHLGKDMARKIVDDLAEAKPTQVRHYNNLDLQIGGEGMKGYYDQIIPQAMNDILKQYGVKDGVKEVGIRLGENADKEIKNYKVLDNGMIRLDVDDSPRLFYNKEHADDFLKSFHETSPHMGVEITPELREKILSEGLPHFRKGGKITQSSLEQEFKLNRYMR